MECTEAGPQVGIGIAKCSYRASIRGYLSWVTKLNQEDNYNALDNLCDSFGAVLVGSGQ